MHTGSINAEVDLDAYIPVPTIAALNGHCFAGGMMLSVCCDYRVMTDGSKRNAWMCMNEVRIPRVLYPQPLTTRAESARGPGAFRGSVARTVHAHHACASERCVPTAQDRARGTSVHAPRGAGGQADRRRRVRRHGGRAREGAGARGEREWAGQAGRMGPDQGNV